MAYDSLHATETSSSFTRGSRVEVYGGGIFGTGYEGSWHSGTVLPQSTSSRQPSRIRYDVQLDERAPRSTEPQVARRVLCEHLRPLRTSTVLSWSDLQPGLIVEHRLPEVSTCWWLAVVVSIQDGIAYMAYPASGMQGSSYQADPSHSFRTMPHWDPAASMWLSAWMGPFADQYQECMKYHFCKLYPVGATDGHMRVPDVHERVTAASAAVAPLSGTALGPDTPRAQGTASYGELIANRVRTPRGSVSRRVRQSASQTLRTPRSKLAKPTAAGRLGAVQRAAGKASSAPFTPRKGKRGPAESCKGAETQRDMLDRIASVPTSAQTLAPPAHVQPACESLHLDTPRRSGMTGTDVVTGVEKAASVLTSNSGKVPRLPIGRQNAPPAENSLVALSPRVLDTSLQAQPVEEQLPATVSAATCQTCPSNDLLVVYNKRDATQLRKRMLDAACKGEIVCASSGGSWDLGDLGDVAGDWAPTMGSTNICFVRVQELQKAQQEMECAARQLISLKCSQD